MSSESWNDCEVAWLDLCRELREHRYIEMLDRSRRCYARLTLPSEKFYVWFKGKWMAASESDNFGHWEPVTSHAVVETR